MALQEADNYEDFCIEIGRSVKEVRESIGMTQEELASKASLCLSTIFQIEAGHSIHFATLFAVKKALGCDWNELNFINYKSEHAKIHVTMEFENMDEALKYARIAPFANIQAEDIK